MPDNDLHAEVADRFGVLPNFFRLAPRPEITANLWGFAQFGYLDNPLPSLFKERLFVYLSRFCEVRYCITRHVGFLVGLGRPSGDRHCPPETVEQVVRLIRRPLPQGDALEPHLALLKRRVAAGRRCAGIRHAGRAGDLRLRHARVPPDARCGRCLDALRRVFDEPRSSTSWSSSPSSAPPTSGPRSIPSCVRGRRQAAARDARGAGRVRAERPRGGETKSVRTRRCTRRIAARASSWR